MSDEKKDDNLEKLLSKALEKDEEEMTLGFKKLSKRTIDELERRLFHVRDAHSFERNEEGISYVVEWYCNPPK